MNNGATKFLGLGSNLSDREGNLSEARRRLAASGVRIVKASSFYETEPVGYPNQPWFLNQVLQIDDSQAASGARELLGILQRIEAAIGRERTIRYGPRTIDIDLLLYGDLVTGWSGGALDGETLIVPHPRMHERRFVLAPVCELAAELTHPALGLTFRRLLEEVSDSGQVRRIEP
jgi:2-amino-4-hydroxy-6-hydroxymethyldihydropteridine diphosphokinase